MVEVLIVSKSFIIREALEIFFKDKFKNCKVSTTIDLEEDKNIDFSRVNLIFIDIENDIFDKINKIKEINKDIRILILDKNNNINVIKKVIISSIDGYLVDIYEKEELFYIINQIIKGKKYYDSDIIKNLIFDGNCSEGINLLTARENEIFELVVDGLTNKDIAKQLYITEHTIKKHIRNILFKLDMRNRKELIIYAKTNYNI